MYAQLNRIQQVVDLKTPLKTFRYVTIINYLYVCDQIALSTVFITQQYILVLCLVIIDSRHTKEKKNCR